MYCLDPYERVKADSGYGSLDPTYAKTPDGGYQRGRSKKMMDKVRGRHETVNKRLKQWGILAQIYRHNKVNHIDVVWAVAIITQIAFNQGEGLYPCKDYKDEF